MAKTRSPNYPSLNLRDAISKACALWEKEYQHPTPREVVAKSLGYSGLNGASMSQIGALRSYGLIEQVGDQSLKVTDIAMTAFIHDPGSPERKEAIQQMAFAPAVFSELRSVYGQTLPSNSNVTAHLIRKGFTPKSATEVIRTYRDTLDFVQEEIGDAEIRPPASARESSPAMQSPSPLVAPPISRGVSSVAAFPRDEETEVLSVRLSEDSWARTVFTGNVTQAGVDRLIKLLELQKDTFPTQSPPRATEAASEPTDDGSGL